MAAKYSLGKCSMKTIGHLRFDQRGQDAVEFALLLPVLMMILVGMVDLGRMFHAAITISNAAREGARYGIEHPTDLAGIEGRVRAEGVGTWIDLNDATLTTIARVCPTGCVSGSPIRVEVTYNLHLMVPGLFGWDDIPVESYAEMLVL
jgi:Flp pilus assembly protein TadG